MSQPIISLHDINELTSLLKRYAEEWYLPTDDTKTLILMSEAGLIGAEPHIPFLKDRRQVLVERRKTLVALALASKYAIYKDPSYTEMLIAVAEAVKKYFDDLDPIEKVSLLYIYEVANILLNKLGKTPLDISWLRTDEIADAKPSLKAGIASLLYDLYKITKNNAYLNRFYNVLSGVDFKALYITLREEEIRNISVLKEYYDVDYESAIALSVPLDEVELALIAKLMKTIKDEFLFIPIIGFSDFVSKYYSIPRLLLKIWLIVSKIIKKREKLKQKTKHFDYFVE